MAKRKTRYAVTRRNTQKVEPTFLEQIRAFSDWIDRIRTGKWGIFINGRREYRRRRFRNYLEFRQALLEDVAEGKIPASAQITVKRIDSSWF
jgi:hypothetical protein